jgi:hypothetical protein
MWKKLLVIANWLLVAWLLASPVWAQQQEQQEPQLQQEELAKKSQNPIGNLISVPLENNFEFGVGPEGATVYVLNLKPVYPVNLGTWNLINRFIMPVIYQEERVEGEGSEFGLGDFTYQAFFSPADPGAVLWGVGPAILVPTNTDERLGRDKWSVGPAAVVVARPGHWLFGGLVQNMWSVAGDSDEDDVRFFSFQYFINYNFKNGWYLSSTPTITADWEADSDDRWTVPFGGGVGRLVRFGKQPVDFKLQAFWNAEKPDGGAEWALQFQVKLLFPK